MEDFQNKSLGADPVPTAPMPQPTPPTPTLDEQSRAKLSGFAKGATIETNKFWGSNKFFVTLAILGVLLIGFTLLWLMHGRGNNSTKEANVDITIQAPEQTPGGTDFVYRFQIQNKDTATLSGNELELIYPDGITFIDSQPSATTNFGRTFSIPDLKSGDPAIVVSVRTRVQGNIGDLRKMQAIFHYHLNGAQGLAFSKQAEHVVRIISSDVNIELHGPAQANNAQLVTYDITYSNKSDKPLDNARVSVTYPPGFSFGSSEPGPDLSNNTWNVPRLNPGESGKITVSGNFLSAVAGETKQWQVAFQMTDNQGNFYTQATGDFSTTISSLPLLVSQQVENVNNNVVNPGDTLRFTISYQNNSSVAAKGVNIIASLDSKVLDLSTIQAEGAQINNNTIIWNASSKKDLEVLSPNDNGQVSYSVRIKNPPVKDGSTKLTVNSKVKIKSDEYSEYLPGNDISLKVSTKASFGQTVDFAGGSVPPKAGTQTLFKVTWTVRDTSNEINNATVSGFTPLGSGSFVVDSVSPGEAKNLNFDDSTGRITWNVGNVPAYAGSLQAPRTVSFTLKALPSRSQVGSDIVIVKDVTFSAKDSFTGQNINQDGTSLNSSDAAGQSGSGAVQP